MENIHNDTVAAQRLICDHLATVNDIKHFDICNKRLLISCSSARQKYFTSLVNSKKEQAATMAEQKRKVAEDEITHLKKRGMAVQSDMDSLITDADNYAVKAEAGHNVKLIAK